MSPLMTRCHCLLGLIHDLGTADREVLISRLGWSPLAVDQVLDALLDCRLISGNFRRWTADPSRRFTLAMDLRLTLRGRIVLVRLLSALAPPEPSSTPLSLPDAPAGDPSPTVH